jgi:putative ABC transport system permease protein
MNRLSFYLRYALRSLRRDGTRTLLAGLSVAFGVLSLVAMQSLSTALLHGDTFDQHIQIGGDVSIHAPGPNQRIDSTTFQQITTWQKQNIIATYTPLAQGSATFLRTPTSGRVTFLSRALGIDPATYPLVGQLVLRDPAGAKAADVLQHPTDALLTRDIADPLGLHVGDSFILSGDGAPVQLTLAGIIAATPDQRGHQVLYSLDTARLIDNRADVITSVVGTLGTAPNAVQTLNASSYPIFIAANRDATTADSAATNLFDLMLKGAGVLGLLVGGLSVSNTLQVILARRKLEIAMLKTVGYQRGDLLTLIALETGLIGIVGGVVGALIGVAITGKLLDVLASSGALLLAWSPDPVIVGGGIAVGLLTAVVFGMQTILASSATRPIELLRDLPTNTPSRDVAARLALYGLLLVIFGLLVGIVLGSIPLGVAFVMIGSLGLVILRAIFWVILWIVTKLPAPPIPSLRLARASLKQRKMLATLSLIALFAGAFSVTFAVLAIYNAQVEVTSHRGSDAGYNLLIYTTIDGADKALGQMTTQGAQSPYLSDYVIGTLDNQSITVEGRSAADLKADLNYTGNWSDTGKVALLAPDASDGHKVGDTLTLQVNNQQQTVTLIGFYTRTAVNSLAATGASVIVPRAVAEALGGTHTQVQVIGQFPVVSLETVTTTIGTALPDALVFSRADLNDSLASTYRTLFTFAISIAGLAFVAGAVLIANSAGLTVVERRGEIGVFKAVGYTSGHVLRLFLSEYGFLGTLAGLFGIVGAVVAILLINVTQPGANLVIEPTIVGGMLLFSIAIALVSAAVVTWPPTRVRPLDVLRYE